MRRHMTPLMLVLVAACSSPATPDDRAIEVISETGPDAPSPAQPIETPDEIEAQPIASEPVVDTSAQCDEDRYKSMVGQAAGGMQFPVGPSLRVFGTNDIITQELVPQRTNIVVDDSGTIVRVYCG